MTPASDEETRHRLAGLEDGPWAPGVAVARSRLGPIRPAWLDRIDAEALSLADLPLGRPEALRARRLERVLRPHTASDPIVSRREMATRKAFDDALTVPQLYELAVQTSYLPVDAVRIPARTAFANLLWAPAARRFVTAYDYVAIPMLAQRVQVAGFPAVEPPEPNPRAAVRFSGFLAHLRAFYADDDIATWTAFLDDFAVWYPDGDRAERDALLAHLRGRESRPPRRADRLVAGCRAFVGAVSSAFDVLQPDELGRFALLHAYWLQKFFGYRLDALGYVEDDERWGAGESWAAALTDSETLWRAAEAPLRAVLAADFRERVEMLRQAFEAARAIVAATRVRDAAVVRDPMAR